MKANFQSPIRRDEGCDAKLFPKAGRALTFQSPIRRDEGCDLELNADRLNLPVAFSPLFVGMRVATDHDGAREGLDGLPFSPLFVGMRVATGAHIYRAGAEGRPFSPLFVGMRVATAPSVHHRGHQGGTFQSPIRRDEGCDSPLGAGITIAAAPFSPLFVGMRVATGDGHGRHQAG